MNRAAYLEDPAQLDPDKRRAGIDGLRAGGRFTDPDAFATALARGAGHRGVREALEQAFDPDRKPREVKDHPLGVQPAVTIRAVSGDSQASSRRWLS
jgi:hypothetical protein